MESQEEYSPRPVKDPSLSKTLAKFTQSMKSKKEFEDLFDYEGKDIVVFVYSSEMEHDFQRQVVENFKKVAKFFKDSKKAKSLKFVSYDLNQNGPSRKIKLDVPAMYFSPAFKRDQPLKFFMGDPRVEDMAAYIVKHADVKISVSTKNLDQNLQIQEMVSQQQEERPDIMDEVERIMKERGEL